MLKLGLDPALAVNSPLLNLAAAKVDEHTPFIKRNVDGDGNCCWRAVSLLFTGSEEYYWEIREAVFVELKEYADLLREYLKGLFLNTFLIFRWYQRSESPS